MLIVALKDVQMRESFRRTNDDDGSVTTNVPRREKNKGVARRPIIAAHRFYLYP